MTEAINPISSVIPAAAETIYRDWLNGKGHAAMTGADATGTEEIGGKFTAWSGYISGETVEVDENKRIVQKWRTTEFPTDAEDSILTVTLESVEGGTKVALTHTNIPQPQAKNYEQGWFDHYFEPMAKYYGSK